MDTNKGRFLSNKGTRECEKQKNRKMLKTFIGSSVAGIPQQRDK